MEGTIEHNAAEDLKTLKILSSSLVLTKLEFKKFRNFTIVAYVALTGYELPTDGNA